VKVRTPRALILYDLVFTQKNYVNGTIPRKRIPLQFSEGSIARKKIQIRTVFESIRYRWISAVQNVKFEKLIEAHYEIISIGRAATKVECECVLSLMICFGIILKNQNWNLVV